MAVSVKRNRHPVAHLCSEETLLELFGEEFHPNTDQALEELQEVNGCCWLTSPDGLKRWQREGVLRGEIVETYQVNFAAGTSFMYPALAEELHHLRHHRLVIAINPEKELMRLT